MGKFNLRKILMADYDVDFIEATNFEQWVGKNLDYEAVMDKNFKDINFKSLKTNRKDFLKEIVEKSSKLEMTKSIKTIMDTISEDRQENKNLELYDKIRRLELEIAEKNTTIDNQKKKIDEISAPNMFKENLLEAQSKIISEYNSYLRNFDLGFNMVEYEKAIGNLTFKRMENLKSILIENGMDESKVDGLLNIWRERQQSAYNGEREVNVGFNNYHEKREKLREQFNFIRKNSDFVDAVIFLKGVEVFTEKEENKKNDVVPWFIKTKDLVTLGKVFISDMFKEDRYYKSGWLNSTRVIFGNSKREFILEEIGAKYKLLTNDRNKVIEVYEPIDSIIEKFNKKAIEILNKN